MWPSHNCVHSRAYIDGTYSVSILDRPVKRFWSSAPMVSR